jgi:hypothetical protein
MVTEYAVEPKDIGFLSEYLTEGIDYDFGRYAYFLSCYRADE